MEQWYTLYTKPHCEYKVATALRQRGLLVYLPEIEASKLSQSGKKLIPFFPCYLFCKIDFEAFGLSHIQWTSGLRRILAFDDRPLPVSESLIDLIRFNLREIKTSGDWLGPNFRPGETVRITNGPFRDMLAIFEGPTTASQRVQILLKVLGSSRMQIEVEHLEKVEKKTEATTPVKRPRRTRGRGRTIKKQHQQAV